MDPDETQQLRERIHELEEELRDAKEENVKLLVVVLASWSWISNFIQ